MSSVKRPITTIAAAAFVLAACARDAEPERPRHLILVTVDTLRADHLSAWGYPRATSDAAGAEKRGTPAGFALDELAAQGTRFAHAFTPRGETFPALCTLFTGKPPPETGVLGNRETLAASHTTLAERLRAAGFRTAAFTTNKLLVPGSGIEQGFEVLETDFGEERDAVVLEGASRWIAAQPADARCFVWVHLMGPHLPYAPRPSHGVDFASAFADAAYAGPANGSREFIDAAYTEQRALPAADRARIGDLYDGEIARVDQLVGRFARGLGARLDESLLVFTADHGEELGERSGYFGHSKSVSSAVLHVPLFFRWPNGGRPGGIPAGARRDEVVQHEDLLATLLALFGLPPEKEARGLALDRLLRGGPDPRFDGRVAIGLWRFDVFTAADAARRVVWNPEKREPQELPRGPYPVPELALYDRAKDPAELVDRAPEDRAEAERYVARIRSWSRRLVVSSAAQGALSPERRRALIDQGYVGDDDDH